MMLLVSFYSSPQINEKKFSELGSLQRESLPFVDYDGKGLENRMQESTKQKKQKQNFSLKLSFSGLDSDTFLKL